MLRSFATNNSAKSDSLPSNISREMASPPPLDGPLDIRPLGALELANSARRGHPTTVPYAKMSSKGRTELKICLSRAKNVEEAAGDVRFSIFPQ